MTTNSQVSSAASMTVPMAGTNCLVIVGATGMVGGYALRYALDNSDVKSVTSIGRKKLGISHPKLKEVLHQNFADCSPFASRPFSPKASFLGSLGAIITFLLTISFLFSTPGALQLGNGISILGDTGQFLVKDLVLLGASCWIAADALGAVARRIDLPV